MFIKKLSIPAIPGRDEEQHADEFPVNGRKVVRERVSDDGRDAARQGNLRAPSRLANQQRQEAGRRVTRKEENLTALSGIVFIKQYKPI